MMAKGGGTPLGPTGYLIGAAVCAVAAVYLLVCTLHPRLRQGARWGTRIGGGGKGAPFSVLSGLVWVLNALLWGVTFPAHGLRCSTIQAKGGWPIGGGFLLLWMAAVRDCVRGRQEGTAIRRKQAPLGEFDKRPRTDQT